MKLAGSITVAVLMCLLATTARGQGFNYYNQNQYPWNNAGIAGVNTFASYKRGFHGYASINQMGENYGNVADKQMGRNYASMNQMGENYGNVADKQMGGDYRFSGYGNTEDQQMGGNYRFSGYGNTEIQQMGGNYQFSGYGNAEDQQMGGNYRFSGYGNTEDLSGKDNHRYGQKQNAGEEHSSDVKERKHEDEEWTEDLPMGGVFDEDGIYGLISVVFFLLIFVTGKAG